MAASCGSRSEEVGSELSPAAGKRMCLVSKDRRVRKAGWQRRRQRIIAERR